MAWGLAALTQLVILLFLGAARRAAPARRFRVSSLMVYWSCYALVGVLAMALTVLVFVPFTVIF